MEEHALVREGPRRALPPEFHPDRRRSAYERRPIREEPPHVIVLLFRWVALYAILLSAVWAFLSSPGAD